MKTENKNAIPHHVRDSVTGSLIDVWIIDKTNGDRLTSCCGAYSTHMDTDKLCCKVCYMPVEIGEGDGVDNAW